LPSPQQADGGDRVLCLDSDNDVPFDEEFYKHLCGQHGALLNTKVFFFVDNRNVIGKDVPFQLAHLKRFGVPLFSKSVVLAHDVGDFSKMWQAMGRSRTMNHTTFAVYIKQHFIDEAEASASAAGAGAAAAGAGAAAASAAGGGKGLRDIKEHPLSRQLYVQNCDQKVAGNLSSMYQTLISLFNLAKGQFYFCDDIVNTFLEKMEGTITGKVKLHEKKLGKVVFNIQEDPIPARILQQILSAKFSKSCLPSVVAAATEIGLSPDISQELLKHVVQQKYEQRAPSGNEYDDYLRYLSGEQQSLMEISYTKQQQKQKQVRTRKLFFCRQN
jgi:hypothetical protein